MQEPTCGPRSHDYLSGRSLGREDTPERRVNRQGFLASPARRWQWPDSMSGIRAVVITVILALAACDGTRPQNEDRPDLPVPVVVVPPGQAVAEGRFPVSAGAWPARCPAE